MFGSARLRLLRFGPVGARTGRFRRWRPYWGSARLLCVEVLEDRTLL
jgi:hypothetical protein